MYESLSDLLDELDGIHRRVIAAARRDPSAIALTTEVVAVLESAIRAGGDDRLDDALRVKLLEETRLAFYALPDRLHTYLLNGWKSAGPRPPRRDLLAAAELSAVRRVLSISVASKTLVPSLHWALCDSSAAVRIEIQEGATLDQVMNALGWVVGSLGNKAIWRAMIDPTLSDALATCYQGIDLVKSTAKAVEERREAMAAGQVAAGQKT